MRNIRIFVCRVGCSARYLLKKLKIISILRKLLGLVGLPIVWIHVLIIDLCHWTDSISQIFFFLDGHKCLGLWQSVLFVSLASSHTTSGSCLRCILFLFVTEVYIRKLRFWVLAFLWTRGQHNLALESVGKVLIQDEFLGWGHELFLLWMVYLHVVLQAIEESRLLFLSWRGRYQMRTRR